MDSHFKAPLLDEVETFLSQSKMSATRLGSDAVNDGSFVTMLRDGMEPRNGRASRVRQFMREYRPSTPTDRDPKPPLPTTGGKGEACVSPGGEAVAVLGEGEAAA